MEITKVDLYEYFGKKRDGSKRGYLYVYQPTFHIEHPATRIRPAMIVVPGGGYAFWSFREGEPIVLNYMANGFIGALLDYSLAPESYPTQLFEGLMAVMYLRENAEKLHIDKEHICAIGFSAGGHLCGTMATLFNDDIVKKEFGERADNARLDAVILSYPVITSNNKSHYGSIENVTHGNHDLYDKVSIEKQVTSASSPAFIWSTQADDVVPVENSLLVAEAYVKAKVPMQLHIFERGRHGLSLANNEVSFKTDNDSTDDNVAQWFGLSMKWLTMRGFVIKNNQ